MLEFANVSSSSGTKVQVCEEVPCPIVQFLSTPKLTYWVKFILWVPIAHHTGSVVVKFTVGVVSLVEHGVAGLVLQFTQPALPSEVILYEFWFIAGGVVSDASVVKLFCVPAPSLKTNDLLAAVITSL